jgi:hypothetical protein
VRTVGFPRTATDGSRDDGRVADEVRRGVPVRGQTFAAELSVHVFASARCPAGLPGEAAGKGGCDDGRAGGPGKRDAYRAEQARAARAFVSEVLGPGHPCGDVAILLVREIFGNSIRHSGSGGPGETVAVRTGDGVLIGEAD